MAKVTAQLFQDALKKAYPDDRLARLAGQLEVDTWASTTTVLVCQACGYIELASDYDPSKSQLGSHEHGGCGPTITGLLHVMNQHKHAPSSRCLFPTRVATEAEVAAYSMGGFDAIKALVLG